MEYRAPRARASVTFQEASPLESGEVAAACASLGWRVLPLSKSHGLPMIKQWQIKATTNLDVIEEWWGQRFHGAGVGIATGEQSGIWVLDLDVKNGLNGPAALKHLQEDHGVIPETWTVQTKSGGLHLYFRYPDDGEGIRNSTSMIAPGIDVRGKGGYVRAPIRVESVLITKQPAVAPEWLLKKARWTKKIVDASESTEVWGSWMAPRDRMERESLVLSRITSGGRNDALNRAAYSLASGGPGVDRDVAWGFLKWACERNGLWEDEPEGCVATFNSGWDAGRAAGENENE